MYQDKEFEANYPSFEGKGLAIGMDEKVHYDEKNHEGKLFYRSTIINNSRDIKKIKDTISEIFKEFIDMYDKEYHNPIRCFNRELYERLRLLDNEEQDE